MVSKDVCLLRGYKNTSINRADSFPDTTIPVRPYYPRPTLELHASKMIATDSRCAERLEYAGPMKMW